jgi:hypothetical protein
MLSYSKQPALAAYAYVEKVDVIVWKKYGEW